MAQDDDGRVDLPGADVHLRPGWLPATDADRLFAALRDRLPWSVHRIRLFGREVPAPRLSCWIGDEGAGYRYSGMHHVPVPWPAELLPVRARLESELGTRFDSVLAQLYRDGNDAIGWHADAEPELGPSPVIASLSLGGTRRFAFKPRPPRGGRPDDGARGRIALELSHGSLLVMGGATQEAYLHAVPRTRRPVQPRVNLTFRQVGGAADARHAY